MKYCNISSYVANHGDMNVLAIITMFDSDLKVHFRCKTLSPLERYNWIYFGAQD